MTRGWRFVRSTAGTLGLLLAASAEASGQGAPPPWMLGPFEKPAGVKMGVEFATRGHRAEGDYCGAARYAEIHFKAYTLENGRLSRQLDLAFAGLPCGTEINDAARINSRLIPELTIRE